MVTLSRHTALKLLWPSLTPAIIHHHLPLWVLWGFRSVSRLLWRPKEKVLRISVIWECGEVGDPSLQRSSPAQVCSCRAELLLMMLLLWKDPNQDIFGSYLWKRTQIWDILGVPPLVKDPNWDILFLSSGRTQTRTFWVLPLERDPCQDILDPSPGQRHKQGYFASLFWKRTHGKGYFGSLLWKRTQAGIFWVPLLKRPNTGYFATTASSVGTLFSAWIYIVFVKPVKLQLNFRKKNPLGSKIRFLLPLNLLYCVKKIWLDVTFKL